MILYMDGMERKRFIRLQSKYELEKSRCNAIDQSSRQTSYRRKAWENASTIRIVRHPISA
jgi:hypothetical protein